SCGTNPEGTTRGARPRACPVPAEHRRTQSRRPHPENHQTGPRSRHPLTGQAALLPGGNGNNPVSNASINAIAPPRAAALNPNVDGSIRQFPLFGAKEYAAIASRHDGNSHGDSGTKYPPRIIALGFNKFTRV